MKIINEFQTVKVNGTHSRLYIISRRIIYSCENYRATLILGLETIGIFPTDQARWLSERLNEASIRIEERGI